MVQWCNLCISEGVVTVKADRDAKKLTVTGNLDPAWLREKIEAKTKKKVELLSPLPKPAATATATAAGGGGDKKAEEKKVEEKKPEDSKEAKEVTIQYDNYYPNNMIEKFTKF